MPPTSKQRPPRARVKVSVENEVSGVRTQPTMPAAPEAPSWTRSDSFRPPAAGHVDFVQLPKRRK